MRVSQTSSSSFGRAFSAGKEPITPERHWAITKSGFETMKSGAPITGSARRPWREGGRGMEGSGRVA
jgi:hypothetical protein